MADDSRGKVTAATRFGVGAVSAGPATTIERIEPLEAEAELAPGMRVRQYELIRELGRGGMGVVYAARDTKLGRRVAIKFLRHATREVADRFLIEARATAQCNHDNIVIIHEVDEHEGTPYMVLELVEGPTLRELMGPFGEGVALPQSRVIELVLPVARALTHAHELGIVHRDLKPENIVVTHAGHVKVLDFGIAKAIGAVDVHGPHAASGDLRLTNDGALIGTLPYMSPEQMGVDEVDHRADLWALGVIMFEMIAGRHPVDPLTTEVLFDALTSAVPMPHLNAIAPDASVELGDVVEQCLRKRKADRIPSAGALAHELEQLLPSRRTLRLTGEESPYPGLTAFGERDADRFFGRARDIARTVPRVRETPLTGIIGPSGVGKSSFVRAGIAPALKASGERWEIVTLRPGRQPIAALATVVERLGMQATPRGTPPIASHERLVGHLRSEPGYLGTFLRERARASGGHILVLVDQLEELYTLGSDPDERRAFLAALGGVADDAATPLRVVVAMRSDLVDRLAEDRRFMDDLTRGLVFLATPDRDGLRDALVGPAELVGYRFEATAMVDDMLDALAGTPALSLLQFAAAKLWDLRDRDRRLLTAESYQAIGGISGALTTHADEVVKRMDAVARTLAEKILRRLVTPERTRATVELSELRQLAPEPADITRVIDLLVAAGLLAVSDSGGSVELVHASLISRWPTLRRLLDENQEDAAFLTELGTAAKQWEARGRPIGLLWRGDALEPARRWYVQRPRELAARDQAFLDAALALARRGRRLRRVALVGSFVTLLAIAAGASVAYFQMRTLKQEARSQAERAETSLRDKLAADAAKAAAETQRTAAEAQRNAAEQQESKAEEATAVAQHREKMTLEELRRTADDLEKRKLELETALRIAGAAKDRAERLSADRKQATDEANAAKVKLGEALAAEKARVKQLEDEKKALSTKLKGE